MEDQRFKKLAGRSDNEKMPTVAAIPLNGSFAGARVARENIECNLSAMIVSQPSVADLLAEVSLAKEWVLARDGSLTAMEANGRWWADCSVPLLAGRALLKTLQAGQTGSCLLAPGNAGLVVAARERIGRFAPLFVVQPDVEIARMIVGCHDFSDDIARHRLWLVCGTQWTGQLRALFTRYPGLATPVQFIRTKLTSEVMIAPIIQESQAVFSNVVSDRGQQIEQLRKTPVVATDARNILIIGGVEFRLWNDGATVLHEQLSQALKGGGGSVTRFDTDEPLAGSPIALLQAASACGSVISANLCRPDCNNLVSLDIPWITWMTRAGAPPFETAGPKDGLVLADNTWRDIARRAGWPDNRVYIAPSPGTQGEGGPSNGADCKSGSTNQRNLSDETRSRRDSTFDPHPTPLNPLPENRKRELGILDNTRKIDIPASVKQFSSHRLLWELIEEELAVNPFAVENIDDYLTNRSGQLNIGTDALDRRAFTEQLILPAYSQGLARLLMVAGLPLSLWGEGWDEMEEFAAAARGPLQNRDAFQQAVAQSTALVYCWPERAAHPIDAAGKPVVHRNGNDADEFIRIAKSALKSYSSIATVNDQSLAGVILKMLVEIQTETCQKRIHD